MSRSPVLMLVFNRPDFARRCAEAVVAQRPPKLYLAADGPRHRDESVDTDASRRAVLDTAQGRVPVETLFRERNLGCKRAVEEAVSWFLDKEPEGIIIEDDCLPSPAFFEFCDSMLTRYRDTTRVMHVAGYCHVPTKLAGYRFSQYPAVWGWATWRRAWQTYPITLPAITPELRREVRSAFASGAEYRFFTDKWHQVATGRLDTWDFSWCYALLTNGGLAVQPLLNLVDNIGVGDARAAHTRRAGTTSAVSDLTDGDMSVLRSSFELPDYAADRVFFRSRIGGSAWMLKDVKRLLSRPLTFR
jgi:hypothetical protein